MTEKLSGSVQAAALYVLQISDPEEKCVGTEELLSAWRADRLNPASVALPAQRIPEPGRPHQPMLVRPQALRARGPGTLQGRQALLHAVAHIEFNAINLALDAVYRFPALPPEFSSDWLQVAAEEARHFRLLRQRLIELGSDYGTLPAHNGLWEMALKTDHDPMIRMALVPRVLEARGLDVTPGMIQRLEAAGDKVSADLLRLIQREEVSHVAIGTHWFRHLAEARGLVPESTFLDLITRLIPGMVRLPFAEQARLKAGFTEQELALLTAHAQTQPGSTDHKDRIE